MEVVLPPERYGDDADCPRSFASFPHARQAAGSRAASGTSQLPLSGASSTEGVVGDQARRIGGFRSRPADRDAGLFRGAAHSLIAGRDFSRRGTAASAGSWSSTARSRGGTGPDARRSANASCSRDRAAAATVGGRRSRRRRSPFEARHPAVPEIYVSYEQRPADSMVLTVGRGPPGALAAALRRRSHGSMGSRFSTSARWRPCCRVDLRCPFPDPAHGLRRPGALLAAAGISSIIAYSVEQRRESASGRRSARGASRCSSSSSRKG